MLGSGLRSLRSRVWSTQSLGSLVVKRSSQRSSSTLVIAEHDNSVLQASTLNTLGAASLLNNPISVLVAGWNLSGVTQQLVPSHGIKEILVAESEALEHGLPEPLADLLVSLQRERQFSHILAPASTFGKNFLPRAAALLDVASVADVIQIVDNDTFIRPIYAGNALAKVRVVGSGPRMCTVRTTAFSAPSSSSPSPAQSGTSAAAEPELVPLPLPPSLNSGGAKWVGREVRKSDRPELGSARVVVSGGRGLKNAESFVLLEELADALGGGAVGASRAAVDAGFVPNDLQVGQTGKVVAPELYVAVGISGAIQHLAGMKDSKTIVAINKDAEAPIFQVADYGLVGDLFDILPRLISKVRSAQH